VLLDLLHTKNISYLYSAFETWWHTVTHERGTEGETVEWSG